MKINTYPDNTTYISDTKLGEQVFRINTYSDLCHLNQFVDAFHSQFNTNQIAKIIPNIVIPNLLTAQEDRRFNQGESFGLKLVLKFLAGLNANFTIFHPHNEEVVSMAFEILDKKVNVMDNSEFIKKVLSSIAPHTSPFEEPDEYDNLILMSSDAGGFKPLMKLCDKLGWKGETYSASKSRKYEDGKSKLVQLVDRENFNGKDVLLIDDMAIGGATFIGLSKMLRERNCGKLYLAVSHLTVENPNPELFKTFDRIFTTNSKGYDYKVIGSGYDKLGYTPENLEIINLF